MKKFATLITTFAIAVLGSVAVLPFAVQPAHATTTDEMTKGYQAAGGGSQTSSTASLSGLIKTVIDVLLYVLGAVAVIMIVIGGIKYTTSNGDQAQVTSAKNTIMYAVIGLIVAIMAYAIVNFVINAFK